ncbi:MAG: amidohydrolase [Mycobacteriales bacterium]
MTTLYRNARVLAPANTQATAFAVDGDRIVWVGDGRGAFDGDVQVDLGGALVTPAFVDAHVHTTSAGLAIGGLDLTGAGSLTDALDLVSDAARRRRGALLLGSGWDETKWPERRPPTAAELDRASWGSGVYLSRVDVHSAVVSSALLAMSKAAGLPGYEGDGLVRLEAHHAVRAAALRSLSRADVAAAQQLALERAASLGIGCLHEMSGPEVAGADDLESLLAISAADGYIDVVGYWGSLGDVETPRRLGLRGAGGDLFCDGTVGSHTAALRSGYADEPDNRGALRYSADDISAHVILAVEAGMQTGFHVIGDGAIDTVLTGFEKATAALGHAAVMAGRHRLEHIELADDDAIARMARLGLVASVQPMFDALWGGEDGMYVTRLGADRAAAMNPLSRFAAAGVPLCLSSDAPVTPFDPWGGVRAAVRHQTPGFRLSPKAAFAAATRGGWRAMGDDETGVLAPGAAATFAVWDCEAVPPTRADERISAWSTDPWWSLTGLPDLDHTPPCLQTVVRGTTVYDSGATP